MSRRNPPEVRSGPRLICKMQWLAVQGARFHRQRPDPMATPEIQPASSEENHACNLHYLDFLALHSARVTEVWRSPTLWPDPAVSVPG